MKDSRRTCARNDDGGCYAIADLGFTIMAGSDSDATDAVETLLPSFKPFRKAVLSDEPLFTLTIDGSVTRADDASLIRPFDTGNGYTTVYRLPNSGYQFVICDMLARECCILQANADFSECRCALHGTLAMRAFGLDNAAMLAFAFAGSRKSAVLVHASCVRHGGRAFPFIAKSGIGKSTHSNLWICHVPDTDLMNDDNPIIRIINGKPKVFGSPWSGKTPCYRNINAPIGAITRIERASQNSIERLTPAAAFAALLPACSSMKWDNMIYGNICDTITGIIETTPIFTLRCRPDKEAALICHDTITGKT